MKVSVSDNIRNIPYYPKAMMYGYEDGWVRLSSNENPYPPSEKVAQSVLDSLFAMNRYPGGEQELKEDLAGNYKLSSDNFLIGNGSNELIEMSFKAMKDDGKNEAIATESSFAFYAIAAQIFGYEIKKVPLTGMHTNLKAVHSAIGTKTRIIFLNNPMNPTGTIFNKDDFEQFISSIPKEILVVVDEAYAEFIESEVFPDTPAYINRFPVLILKTFSKAYGLAGLRIGYGIGEPSLISFLERTKQPFSVNTMALIAARAALVDRNHLRRVLDNNKDAKRFYYETLKGLSLEYVPTEANFVLVKVGKKAGQITKKLFDKKILVRFMEAYNLPEYIRISFGTPEENIRCMEELKRLI